MSIHATQQINSGFGTWYPGDLLDADIPEPVIDAWLAAGLVEREGGIDTAADDPVAPAPGEAATRPVEKATKVPRENSAGRRMQTQPGPHRRFTPKDA